MDTATKPKTETEQLFRDLDKPSLHALSYALRHPDTWPKEFVWNYRNCNQCAMGLAHALWASIPAANRDSGASIMARSFAMPFEAAKSVFLGKEGQHAADWVPVEKKRKWFTNVGVSDHESITPEMVAGRIDAYLATRE